MQMQGVITDASQVEDLMEDDHPVNGDPMLSSPHVPSPGEPHHIDDEDDDDPDSDSLVDMAMVAWSAMSLQSVFWYLQFS